MVVARKFTAPARKAATPAPKAGPQRKATVAAPAPKAAPGIKQKLIAATEPPPTQQPFVAPCAGASKTGCLWCPLAPWHHDFETFKHRYGRDALKIQSKERDGHVIKTRNVAERPWKPVDVLFVGEAPGADEDKQGIPFVGRSGALLRRAIEDVFKIPADKIAITNVVRCRPPRNKDPTKTEVLSCSPDLIREIQARKPKVIVCLGNHSLEFLTGQSGITSLTGRVLRTIRPEFPETTVVGCLHPAYVLRMDFELERFLEALTLANEIVTGNHVALPGPGTYHVLTDIAAVRAMFAKFKADGRTVAFDTETGSLTPFQDKFPKLLCFSFSNGENTAYTVPLDHAESPWREGGGRDKERKELIAILRAFFTDPSARRLKRCGQNEKFDRQHIMVALDLDSMVITDHDTMTKHLVINEKRGTHGLDILAYEFTGMGGYDKPLNDYKDKHADADPEDGGSYANIPGDILFVYAAMDADVTWRVNEAIAKTPDFADNPKFQALAGDFFPKLSEALADMERAGAQIDPRVVAKLDVKLQEDMAARMADIAKLPEIKAFVREERVKKGNPTLEFNPGSTTQLRTVLFDHYKMPPVELTDRGFDIMLGRLKREQAEAKEERRVAMGFSDLVNKAANRREWDLFTTKADALHEYERRKNVLAPLILKYREAETLHGTFVEPLKHRLDPWGRIHGSFWIHGTVTGRLSSSGPNLQNIPNKGGGTIKQCYVSRFGDEGLLLNVDFSQIELRIAAAWFKDPKMRDVYVNKQDLHKLTAAVISGLTPEEFKNLPKDDGSDRSQKAWRNRAKRVNFGALYGGGPPALQATLKKDGVFVTLDECKVFIDRFFAGYPDLRRGMDKLQMFVEEHGYLESFTGRRRRVPEVFSGDRELVARALRQCVNFPIQSGAGDMTLMSLVLINRIMKQEGFRSKAILTVHDSIVFDCHVDEVLEVAKLAKTIMETIPELSDEVLPGLKWDWLDVPIVAECDVGRNWGQMVEFEPAEVEAGEPSDKPLFGPDDKGKTIQQRKPVSIDELWECIAFRGAAA